jgi:hypothetical protein
MNEKDKVILELVRTALLMLVDAVERKLGVEERTADLRKRVRKLAYLESCQLTEN